ncbi:MAG TPA: pyridoxamine 5'-phosphate oxidase family protein [Patescibacteria group bacterium]|nr:pyridoxamine 5'-phosphate oxidase family protein [Patescibacteria group bacterium]
MEQKVHDFLVKNRLCVISIIDKAGNPYSATVFYAYQDDPFLFYFLSDIRTKKVEELVQNKTQRASLVIGFTEGEWKTFQAFGVTSMVEPGSFTEAEGTYYLKYPHAQSIAKDKNLALFAFTPLHWKYTDLNPDTWEIIYSKEK